MTDQSTPAWKLYERLVTAFEVEAAGMDASVTPNAALIGSISGRSRQIDVLVDARWEDGTERRIIFDAKNRSRKVDVRDVEAFEGMMRDVGAARGVIACKRGYTAAALRRAEDLIDIRLLDEEEAMETDFGITDPCPYCIAKRRKTRGIVFWDGQMPLPIGGAWAVIFTGKCDVCRNFAFWCWGCGEKKVLPGKQKHVCGCEWRWFTETSTDEVLFIVATEDGEVPLDRRPLR